MRSMEMNLKLLPWIFIVYPSGKIQLKESYDDDIKAVIPGKTLSEVSKILTGGMEDEVEIFFTKNHVLFELGRTIIISRLIEGNFYNINQMLTNDYETKVTVKQKRTIRLY